MGRNGAVSVSRRKNGKVSEGDHKTSDASPVGKSEEPGERQPLADLGESLKAIVPSASTPLTASKAIELIAHFMAVVPHSSREDMDRLKLLDKFLNTARALMETRLKTEDAQDLSQRLDAIEKELNQRQKGNP